jgi:hypothetical protein
VTLITFQDGKAIFRDGKVGTEQECCCTVDCCLGAVIEVFNNPPTNAYAPQCCAYLMYLPGDDGSGAFDGFPIPVGLSGKWPGPNSNLGPVYVASSCSGQSIVMEISTLGQTVTVNLGADCCPESIDVGGEFGNPADWDLRFGPITFPVFFANTTTQEAYPLYICDEAPTGACCVDGEFAGVNTEFQCEMLLGGTWTENATDCNGFP